MRTDPHADEVRGIVEQVFSGYFQDQDEDFKMPCLYREPEIDETILIDQGRYVARSYRTQGYMAMWLVPVGIVQFYDDLGTMLTTVNLFEIAAAAENGRVKEGKQDEATKDGCRVFSGSGYAGAFMPLFREAVLGPSFRTGPLSHVGAPPVLHPSSASPPQAARPGGGRRVGAVRIVTRHKCRA